MTPMMTMMNPNSETNSQNLSQDESRVVMREFYRKQEQLNLWTAIALGALAVIGLIKILILKKRILLSLPVIQSKNFHTFSMENSTRKGSGKFPAWKHLTDL